MSSQSSATSGGCASGKNTLKSEMNHELQSIPRTEGPFDEERLYEHDLNPDSVVIVIADNPEPFTWELHKRHQCLVTAFPKAVEIGSIHPTAVDLLHIDADGDEYRIIGEMFRHSLVSKCRDIQVKLNWEEDQRHWLYQSEILKTHEYTFRFKDWAAFQPIRITKLRCGHPFYQGWIDHALGQPINHPKWSPYKDEYLKGYRWAEQKYVGQPTLREMVQNGRIKVENGTA